MMMNRSQWIIGILEAKELSVDDLKKGKVVTTTKIFKEENRALATKVATREVKALVGGFDKAEWEVSGAGAKITDHWLIFRRRGNIIASYHLETGKIREH